MYPAPFDYHRPGSVAEAVELLHEHGPDAAALAGGMSLIPSMKARRARLGHVVDIGRLPELTGVTAADGALMIGALTTHAELTRSAVVAEDVPVLAETALQIGDPQVRNAGTIGGSVSEIYPGADLPACLLALRARLHCTGPGGESVLAMDEQFASEHDTATGGLLVTKIEVPVPPVRPGAAHVRVERKAGLAVVGCSAQVTLDERGRYTAVWTVLNGLRPGPVVAIAGDGGLIGQEPRPEVHLDAARAALAGRDSFSDVKATAEYRVETASVVMARALDIAASRGGSG